MIDTTKNIQLFLGDCLEIMKEIPDKSIDMILCDLPYGTTACKWDTIIPFEPLWEQYKRIIKDNGAIVLTASQPFTSALVMSNIKMFKYEWIWDKVKGTGFQIAKFRPMIRTESVLVFGKGKVKYNPQKIKLDKPKMESLASTKSGSSPIAYLNKGTKLVIDRHPTNIIQIKRDTDRIHPTQKPVALMEYLIKTYTNEGDLVLDNCMGSGTTGVACKKLNRKFIGIEISEEYMKISQERIKNTEIKEN
ncbi:MAG: site-specific DNA-methyltransferase [Patescibacteria group bacterium]